MILQMRMLKARLGMLKQFVLLLFAFGSGGVYAADTINGGELYRVYCASCHGGVPGINIMPGAPDFSRNEGMVRPDIFILNAIKNGKNAMPAYQGVLKDRDILDVIAYMRTLN